MMTRMARLSFVLLIAAAPVLAVPAEAQFYDLNGTYHCLTAPDERCKKSDSALPPAPPPRPAIPTVEEAIIRIMKQSAGAADIAVIEKEAAAKEPRAVEALAWCKLNGIGMAADAAAAYLLYGQAAALGIPTARANQQAVFETQLTQEQRQSVLMQEQTQ